MSRLRIAIDHLATQRQNLERSLDEHHSLVALIRKLPPEMLCEIFSYRVDRRRCFYVTEAPMRLSFVCNKWRNVAISIPQLWSSIFLRYQSVATEMLGAWLSRSGIYPLTLYIGSHHHEDDDVAAYFTARIAGMMWSSY